MLAFLPLFAIFAALFAGVRALGLGTMIGWKSLPGSPEPWPQTALRNLLLAWVLTLPVCVLLGAGIFAFGIDVLLRFGVK